MALDYPKVLFVASIVVLTTWATSSALAQEKSSHSKIAYKMTEPPPTAPALDYRKNLDAGKPNSKERGEHEDLERIREKRQRREVKIRSRDPIE
jgi:hypothetical protein